MLYFLGMKKAMDEKNNLNKLVGKHAVFTVPNLLTFFRLLLIPLIVWFYIGKESPYSAILLVVLSALSDILDGYIARKYDMTSDIGRVLDPFADKLTQLAMLLCLFSKFKWIRVLFVVFLVKELTQTAGGYLLLRKGGWVYNSKWIGKISTGFLDATTIVLFLFPNIPERLEFVLCLISAILLTASLAVYLFTDFKKIKGETDQTDVGHDKNV